MTPVRLKSAVPWYQVKHSTTEPLRSHKTNRQVVLGLKYSHFFFEISTFIHFQAAKARVSILLITIVIATIFTCAGTAVLGIKKQYFDILLHEPNIF